MKRILKNHRNFETCTRYSGVDNQEQKMKGFFNCRFETYTRYYRELGIKVATIR